jgi:predicted membrane protein
METFWYDNISVLFEPSKLKKYIPLKSYSKAEKLNAIVRLGIYISILFIILTSNFNYLFIAIFCLGITLLIHTNENKTKTKRIKKNVENYENLRNDDNIKNRNIKVNNYLDDCVLPTDENPFMNVLLTDKRTRKPACKTERN